LATRSTATDTDFGAECPALPAALVWRLSLGLCALAFLLQLAYALARPATESLFLSTHSSEDLPYAWLLVALATPAVVALYNRGVPRCALLRLFAAVSLTSAAALGLLLVVRRIHAPASDYLLYAWREIYMVVLVEAFYSFTNSVFRIGSARWLYGLFGAVGAGGALGGSLLVGRLALHSGTVTALWAVPLLLALVAIVALLLARLVPTRAVASPGSSSPGLKDAVRVVRRSSYLALILATVALVQTVVALVDFQFNAVVERAYPLVDRRTALIGRVYGVIAAATVALHALSGPILSTVGVPITLQAIPITLAGLLAVFVLAPGLVTAALIKGGTKCLDYTVFRNAKEILYIPLSYVEKTVGKSVVDMMTYRLAKVGASALVLAMVAVQLTRLAAPVSGLVLLIWFAVSLVVVRRFRSRVPRADELAGGSLQAGPA
jgi:ATP/ADP translocase